RRHTRFSRDWSSDVCSSDLAGVYRRRNHQQPLAALDFKAAFLESITQARLVVIQPGMIDYRLQRRCCSWLFALAATAGKNHKQDQKGAFQQIHVASSVGEY